MANQRFELFRSNATINLRAWSACNDSPETWADVMALIVLQGKETVENGKIKSTWFVVPGSGTGSLSGLRGEGGFEGDFGKGSDGWLDYWFEKNLIQGGDR
jgi:hypothetical protein